jgi:hypothetical protein
MEIKNMQYWKRKNTLPGLNYESENKLPNGLAKSSALQSTEEKGIRNPSASTNKPTGPVPPEKTKISEKTKNIKKEFDSMTSKEKDDYIYRNTPGGNPYTNPESEFFGKKDYKKLDSRKGK